MDAKTFLQESARTLATSYPHAHKVPAWMMAEFADFVVKEAIILDAAKKAFAYGKPNEFIDTYRTEGPMTETFDVASARATYTHVSLDSLHGIVGAATESAELLALLRDAIYDGAPIGRGKVADEVGDLLWYVALILRDFGLSFEEVMEANIAKLYQRFPEKFSESLAIDPNKVNEQKVVNAHIT